MYFPLIDKISQNILQKELILHKNSDIINNTLFCYKIAIDILIYFLYGGHYG